MLYFYWTEMSHNYLIIASSVQDAEHVGSYFIIQGFNDYQNNFIYFC